MDTGSSDHVFCQESMLKNVKHEKDGIAFNSNGVTMKSNQQGELPNTDQKVWTNENSMTNIISFFKISKAEGMHATHDNNQEDAFVIHHPKTGTMKFLPSQQGLCHHDTAAACLVNTVANNENGHSQRQLQ